MPVFTELPIYFTFHFNTKITKYATYVYEVRNIYCFIQYWFIINN